MKDDLNQLFLHLESINETLPGFPAMIFKDRAVSYQELQGDYLKKTGIRPGNAVALIGHYSIRYIEYFLALLSLSTIIIPIDAEIATEKLGEYLAISQPNHVIRLQNGGTIPRANIRRIPREHPPYRHYVDLAEQNDSGLVLFSSGATGAPKAVVLSFGKLIRKLNHSYHPRCILGFMKLDHISGINTLLEALHRGGTLMIVSERNAKTVFDLIEQHEVDTLPVTPTFLTAALASGELQRHSLQSLKLITYGTEPMPPAVLEEIANLLPHIKLKQTYGLSELGIIPSQSKSNTSTWMKLSTQGYQYSIRDDILWIRSEYAMLGYLNAPDPFDELGFFDTQDHVVTDGEYLKILGRNTLLTPFKVPAMFRFKEITDHTSHLKRNKNRD
jgi:acyl-CoA synthetase (AMP-forming)/AMP-acid ligase II